MRIPRNWRILGALTASLLLAACRSGQPAAPLRFSAVPEQDSTELAVKFAPLAERLSLSLGVPVEYLPSRDGREAVEMFHRGDILLAWFGGLDGVRAREPLPGARAIAQGEDDAENFSYFIAHAGTRREQHPNFPNYVRFMPFCFGPESSVAGRLMPEHFIRGIIGVAPNEFFEKPYIYADSPDRTVELVESGIYQAGVVDHRVFARRVREGRTDPRTCRIIWKTPAFADHNWSAHPALDDRYGEGFTDRLQAALLAIDDPDLLAGLSRERLVAASNEDYEGLRRAARAVGLLP